MQYTADFRSKEEALAFCLSAMENSLYQETMEELGLTPVM